MVEQYKPMITDYFYISNLIKNYVQKNEVEYWDTEYIRFEFYSASKSKEYDAKGLLSERLSLGSVLLITMFRLSWIRKT
ncbi:hypothetical protein [Vibrio parahaemolyticus]|uniref:hypothetical protein n=1 Tax=Vibrio parahaemolyticus TaxID=670 RepID=UPI00248BC2D3|nr:hypothetical protein [Vibrio parahaemolyticus]